MGVFDSDLGITSIFNALIYLNQGHEGNLLPFLAPLPYLNCIKYR